MSQKTFPQSWMCCSSGEKPRLSKSGFMSRSGLERAAVLQFCGSQIWETSWRGPGGGSSPWKASLRLSSSESRTSNAGLKDGSGRRVGGGQFSFSRDWEVLEMNADSQTKKNNTKSTKEVEEVFIISPKKTYQQAHTQHKTTHLVAGTTWTRQEELSKVSPQGDEGGYHPSTGCEEDVELSAVTFSVVVVVVCFNRAKGRVCCRLTSRSMSCFSWITGGVEMSRKSHAAPRRAQRIPETSEWSWGWETGGEKKKKNTEEEEDGEEKGERERDLLRKKIYCTQSYTVIPGGAVSPATATPLQFISMVSASSGKYGIRVVKGNTNKNRQVFQ